MEFISYNVQDYLGQEESDTKQMKLNKDINGDAVDLQQRPNRTNMTEIKRCNSIGMY